MDWNLTPEARRHLRSLIASPGWKIYTERVQQVLTDGKEHALQAETYEEHLQRKGFLLGMEQVSGLVPSLFSVDEEGGVTAWLERRINQELERLSQERGVDLPALLAEQEVQEEQGARELPPEERLHLRMAQRDRREAQELAEAELRQSHSMYSPRSFAANQPRRSR